MQGPAPAPHGQGTDNAAAHTDTMRAAKQADEKEGKKLVLSMYSP